MHEKMSQAVIDLCGSDSEEEGHEPTFMRRHDASFHNKTLDQNNSFDIDNHEGDHATASDRSKTLTKNSCMEYIMEPSQTRNGDSSDEDSTDFMTLPYILANKSSKEQGKIGRKKIFQKEMGETSDSENFLMTPRKGSNSIIEILDDPLMDVSDDSVLNNVNDTFHSPMREQLPDEQVQYSMQAASDAINNSEIQDENCSTRSKSLDKRNDKPSNDECIVLFSSDDENNDCDDSPRKLTYERFNLQSLSNNESSDSEDDILPSPAPFRRLVTFDGKMNQGQLRENNMKDHHLSEERVCQDKGQPKNDADDESTSSVVSWHFVSQQDPDENAAGSRRSKISEQKQTNDIEYNGSDTDDDDELLSQQIFKRARRPPNCPDQALRRNHRGREKCVNSLVSSVNNLLPVDDNRNNSSHDAPLEGLDLMSPVASMGRPSIGSINSASSSRKVKVPIPAIPVANEIGGKLYPDLRNLFIRELIKHAKNLRRFTYQKGPLDGTIRALNDLALYAFPIRTAEAATCIKGIGGELIGVLKDAQNSVKKNQSPYEPPTGKFSSAAAAALVVLLSHEKDKNGDERYLSMEDLLNKVNDKCHCPSGGTIFNRGVDYYLNKTNLDPHWMQIRKLCSIGLIKERKRKTLCPSGLVYELEPDGRQEARALKDRVVQGPVPNGPLRQLAAHSVLEDYGNITVVMDFREGGGGGRKLHNMCTFMDEHEIPYVVRDLKISDYVFFVGDKLVPVLIERKSIEDVASSLHDGRWERQQRNMRKAQYVLGGGEERKCHLCYLIEGDIERTTVHGGFVGRSTYRKTVQDVKNAIEALPELGFSVINSKNKYGSLEKIKRVAKEYLWRANNGSIDCVFTYEKFLEKVKSLSNEKGDPPTDPRHKNPSPPIVEELPLPQEPIVANNTRHVDAEESEELKQRKEQLLALPMNELKELCRERAEKMAGSKVDLVQRLLQQRKPEILITRARRNQYVPKVPSCNAAILVALHLYHEPGTPPLTKEKIMMYAEECGVSKDPMFGNGKGWYDGWSGFKDLCGGDPPLVSVIKRKYALTTQPQGSSGIDVARAIHVVAHRQQLCRCGRYVDIS